MAQKTLHSRDETQWLAYTATQWKKDELQQAKFTVENIYKT